LQVEYGPLNIACVGVFRLLDIKEGVFTYN